MRKSAPGASVENLMRRALQVWIVVSFVFAGMTAAGLVATESGFSHPAVPLLDLWQEVTRGNIQGWATLAIVLLLLAPATTLVTILIGSLTRSDWEKAALSAAVIMILAGSFWLAR